MRDHQGYEDDDTRWDQSVEASPASASPASAPVAAGRAEPERVDPVSVAVPLDGITTLPFAVTLPAIRREQNLDGERPRRTIAQDDPIQLPQPISALRHFARPMLWQDSPEVPNRHDEPASSTFDSLIAPAAAASDDEGGVRSFPTGTSAEPERRRLTWRPVRRRPQHQPGGSADRAHLALVPEAFIDEVPAASGPVSEAGPGRETVLTADEEPLKHALEESEPAREIPAPRASAPTTETDLGREDRTAPRIVLGSDSAPESAFDPTPEPAIGTGRVELEAVRESPRFFLPESRPDLADREVPAADGATAVEHRSDLGDALVLEEHQGLDRAPEDDSIDPARGVEPERDLAPDAEVAPAVRSAPDPDRAGGAEPEPEPEPKSRSRLTVLRASRRARRSARSAVKPVRIPPPPDLVARIRAQQGEEDRVPAADPGEEHLGPRDAEVQARRTS